MMNSDMSLAELIIKSKPLTQRALEWQHKELNMREKIIKLSLGEGPDAGWWILKADITSARAAELDGTGENDRTGDSDVATRGPSA
jgi:hypothetical protein